MNRPESLHMADAAIAAVSRHGAASEVVALQGVYSVACRNAAGELLWTDTARNTVMTLGKNDALDKYLAGSAYTAAFYLMLVGATGYTTGPDAGDTMASHGGWVEDQNYSQGTRPAPSFGTASGGSKATTLAATFTMNASTTIKGVALTTISTKGGTTGILFSAGTFSGGDKVLSSGDTLSVNYTLNA